MHPAHLRIEDHSYELPDERIARYPLPERDASKLLIYRQGHITEDIYRNIGSHIPPGTLMVFNQARVVHARLQFTKPTGGTIEVFCLAPHPQYADVQTALQQHGHVLWECLVGGASKWKEGMALHMQHTAPAFTLTATIAERRQGSYILRLQWNDAALTFAEVLHHMGKVPLPPYLRRHAEQGDDSTYQTVYAKDEGSVAAPTAGLHFTPQVLEQLSAAGVHSAFVTLHVGAGTFIPVKADTMAGHDMHAEWIEVTRTTLSQLQDALGKDIVAVGTTSLRTLETLYWIGNKLLNNEPLHLHGIAVGQWDPYDTATQHPTADALAALAQYMQQHSMERLITRTQILIAPGYTFRVITGLVTNFHQPRSTLLLLVSAIVGDDWRRIYTHALQNDYRFLSYGDGSLLWL
ncbi:S-adenosylmethionine:tRNA ribosyltransferase-isomerase [Nemorincola caseinilytica]|uniref:S-adenosylmethionine:tRNA ribosyltransferase-isomerase n=1 Tax=Nemorincola caseinilytica TaxID=2054315 RepID=A0ABP8ND79_9BACT